MAKDANFAFHYCDNSEFLSSNLSKVLQGSRPSQNCHSSILAPFLESENKMCVSSPSCDILPNCNPFRGVGEGGKPSPCDDVSRNHSSGVEGFSAIFVPLRLT